MIDGVLRWLRAVRNPLLVVLALIGIIGVLALTDEAGRAALSLDHVAVENGEVWRLLTAHLVHLTRAHAFMNTLGLLLIFTVLWEAMDARGLIRACLVSALAISLGILFLLPDVTDYVGWSGITHGVFVWGGLRMLSVRRWFGLLILATVLFKLGWETAMGPTPGASGAIGGLILLQSHLYGAIGGALAWGWERAVQGRTIAVLILTCGLFVGDNQAHAHSADESLARLAFNADGDLELSIEVEVAAFVLREPPGPLSAEAQARVAGVSDAELQDYIDGGGAYLLSTVRLVAEDGTSTAPRRIRMPTVEALRRHSADPTEANAALSTLLLVFAADDVAGLSAPRLHLPPLLGPLFLITRTPDGSETVDVLPPGVASQPLSLDAPKSTWTVVGNSIHDGIRHVVPSGWDHAFFVSLLALSLPAVLLCLGHATVFTLAHSITLIAAGLGWVSVPQNWVEFGIALTVAILGVETLLRVWRAQGLVPVAGHSRRRLATIFVFGLLHGLGFASVFSDLPVSNAALLTALLGFNVGVEIGQVLVIFVVLALLFIVARAISARQAWHLRLVLSAGVALAGIIWTVERMGALSA